MKLKSRSNIAALLTTAGLCRRMARRWLFLAVGAVIILSPIGLVNAQGIIYSVNTTSDTDLSTGCFSGKGTCTLRGAIQAANSHAGDDSIQFNLPANALITLAAALPDITDSVSIDGGGTLTISGNNGFRIFYNSSTLTLRNLTLTNGFAADGGGAIFNLATLNIDNCKLVKNVTGPNGIGGAILTQNRMTISNSEFAENRAKLGGAIHTRFNAALVNITGSNFHHNRANVNDRSSDNGGGFYIAGGTTTVESSTLTDNTTVGAGGGFYVIGATLNLMNVTLSRNEGEIVGGGGLCNSGVATLSNVTLNNNHGYWGGGVLNIGGTATLTNVTFSSNTASSIGGAISNANNGTATLTNVTMSGNAAPEEGSAISGPASLTNTLIARGSGMTGANCSVSLGGSVNLSSDSSCGFGMGRDNAAVLLGPLANNGGLTQTHLPSTNPRSAAIDNGTRNGAPMTDQRGVTRPQGVAVDVGAVEVAPTDVSTLANISTRLRVGTEENALFGGMIATGPSAKKVIIRAIGPTLTDLGLPGALQDPTLELFQGNAPVATNDDWRNSPQQAEIASSGLAPTKERESAIIATLMPNQNYTAIVRGKLGHSGIGVVEAFDLEPAASAKLANISTRGFVDVDDNVMIAGLIVSPSNAGNLKVLVRALGPTLTDFGVQGVLADPTLDLVTSNGAVLRSNDSWQSAQGPQIQAANLAPKYDQEAALVETLATGQYTVIVRGAQRTTGVGLVEVYNIP